MGKQQRREIRNRFLDAVYPYTWQKAANEQFYPGEPDELLDDW